MKIKTQVTISLILFVVLAAIILFSFIASTSQLQEIQKKQQIIDTVESSSFELYYLETDYLVHGGIHPVERWNAKYTAFTEQLKGLTFADPSQQAILSDIFESQRDLNVSFSNLVAVTNNLQQTESSGENQELREFYTSTLSGQTQTLISRSTEISEMVKSEARMVQQRNTLIISLSIALLILLFLLNYLFINRQVLRSISALQDGAERIGSGDLDTEIKITSNDELGYLSRTFNEMVSSIKNARTLLLASNVELEEEITERRVAEDALRESEEKFRGIFDSVNDGVHIHEIKPDGKPGKFIEVNQVASQMLQYTREEMLEHTPLDIITGYHNRPLNTIIGELATNGHAIFETEHRRKDGTVIPVEINSHVVSLQGKRVIVGVVRDITERKLAEATLSRVNQKLSVLSQLTRKDLTNHLFVLSTYLELAYNQLTGQDQVLETLKKVGKSVRLIHATIEYSKEYQEMGAKPPKWQNVNVTMLFGLSHISIGNISHCIETGNLEIFADPLLEKVCQRLFENSVEHGGHVTCIRVRYTLTPDGATIFFEDDGIGIPNEKKEQIFLRGEVTSASRGSLVFVKEILDITGISIWETGEQGKGARFEIMVPKGLWRDPPKSN